ncbi:unnamed protein product [Trichobilharzia regenti]|nr:unnamed protein product [Trichobilharzia regenti]
MEVCEATSIPGQGFADTAYFRDVYLRDQLTDAKHQIPSPNYPYPVAQHQHIYENASTFPVSYTTTAPSTIASGYPLSSFMSETHLHHQHQEYQTVSTFEHFYPKEIDKDQVYANHHHLQQQQQQQQQRIPPQHLPPYTSNSALSTNINPKNIIDEYKTSPFTLPEEVTTPYICKANDVMYSLPISNEKQDCTLNNANNLCNALLLNTDTNISQWDVNDPKLPKVSYFC